MSKLDVKNKISIVKYIIIGGYLLGSSNLLGSVDEKSREAMGAKFLLDRRLLDDTEAGDEMNVRRLIRLGADPDVQDTLGNTPMSFAIQIDNSRIVRELIKARARETALGDSLLHCAAKNGSINVVEMLLKRGDDAGLLNDYGQTALDQARMALNRFTAVLEGKASILRQEIAALSPEVPNCQARKKGRHGRLLFCYAVERQQMQVDRITEKIDKYNRIIELLTAKREGESEE
jgi:hypothetical protein